MKTYIGIDPGQGGAIAFITSYDIQVQNLKGMSPSDLLFLLRDLADANDCWAFVERVAPMPALPSKPGEKPRSMGATSAFNFGREFERPQMLLLGAGIPFDLILPRDWQRAVGLVYPKKTPYAAKKRLGKARAQEMLAGTSVKVTQVNADALMIALACQRIMGAASKESE